MNLLLPLSFPPAASRRFRREVRLSLQAILTGCALGILLVLIAAAVVFLSPEQHSRRLLLSPASSSQFSADPAEVRLAPGQDRPARRRLRF